MLPNHCEYDLRECYLEWEFFSVVTIIKFVSEVGYGSGAHNETGGFLREPLPKPLIWRFNPQVSGTTLGGILW